MASKRVKNNNTTKLNQNNANKFKIKRKRSRISIRKKKAGNEKKMSKINITVQKQSKKSISQYDIAQNIDDKTSVTSKMSEVNSF